MLEFYTGLGYEAIGNVPKTESGGLTMLELPGDEFVSLEVVHDPARGRARPLWCDARTAARTPLVFLTY